MSLLFLGSILLSSLASVGVASDPVLRVAGERRIEAVARQTFWLEGAVSNPDGSPAEGAVVVSSAGGKAVTDSSGWYRLETDVPVDAASVQVTAVGSAHGALASTSVLTALEIGRAHV